MKFAPVLCAVLAATFLSGCAAMFNGTSQQIAIRSNVPDTEIYVNERYVGRNSAVTSFKKNQDYVITARREGCQAMSVQPEQSFDATTLLGILIDWGLISILVVDGVATGAWSDFDQTSYVVDPRC